MFMIYADHAATTKISETAKLAMLSAMEKDWYNPSSLYTPGQQASGTLMDARVRIARCLGCLPKEIYFTSCGSESDNLAIKGIARKHKNKGKHIITTFLEHSSVSSPLTYLKEQGYEIDVLNITSDGKVDVEHLKSLLRQDTILVSICYVDSEVGIVQPIHEIASILKQYPNCFLHVDCTQGIGKVKLDLQDVDLISFAPHKFYGLNGFGGLIKRQDIVLEPLINGGASTTIYRSGTPVIGQICALEKALQITFDKFNERQEYVKKLNKKLRENLSKYENVKINTLSDENPFILNISVVGTKATEFKKKLEEHGVCISIKSACTVTITPSRIVMSMTHDRKRAFASWRISLSHLVKEEEINKFLKIFDKCYNQ